MMYHKYVIICIYIHIYIYTTYIYIYISAVSELMEMVVERERDIYIYSSYWFSSSILACKRLKGNVLSFFLDCAHVTHAFLATRGPILADCSIFPRLPAFMSSKSSFTVICVWWFVTFLFFHMLGIAIPNSLSYFSEG